MIFWNYKINNYIGSYTVWFKPNWYSSAEIICFGCDNLTDCLDSIERNQKYFNNKKVRIKINVK